MSQRSPMNKRNMPNEKKAGATRRSASSAKPARNAAESVHVVPASSKARRAKRDAGESLAGLSRQEKRARKQQRRMMEDRIMTATNFLLKDEPDYPGRHRVWWAFLIVGIVAIVVAWGSLYLTNRSATFSVISVGSLVLAYAAIIGGFIYDHFRIRPMRNEVRARVEGMSDSKLISVLNRAQQAAEQKKRKKKE